MDLIADTTFLDGLWRRQAWALDFATGNPGKTLGIPWVVRGEFWHGAVRAGHDPAEVELTRLTRNRRYFDRIDGLSLLVLDS